MTDKKKEMLRTAAWFVPATLAAGVINGLLGAGGGVIMLYLVRAILFRKGKDEGAQKDAFATVVAVILPVSAVSAVSYAAAGNLDMNELRVLLLPALAGGLFGAYLTDRLPSRIIRWIFAVLVIVSGVRMVW